MNRTHLLRSVALAAAAAAVASWTVLRADRPESSLERIRREGVVRIGYAPEPPFAFRTADGRVTGESPEIARAVFRRLGVTRIRWVQTEFRSLIPELKTGRFDVI
ncbi:MAG: transporter substrate-binding domain-containing protein, partial [Gemmatimonadetes bacterium]|nr:transporter substrate-binding domain-containing protein [Gemmatimonadota bacterium]